MAKLQVICALGVMIFLAAGVNASSDRKLLQRGGTVVPKVIANANKGTPGGQDSTGTGAAQAVQGATSSQINKAASGEKQASKSGPNAGTVPKVIAAAPKGTPGQDSTGTGAAQAVQSATSSQINKAASGEKNSQPASKAHAVPKVIANANKGYNQNPGTGKAQTAQSGTSSAINDAIDKHNAKFENMGR